MDKLNKLKAQFFDDMMQQAKAQLKVGDSYATFSKHTVNHYTQEVKRVELEQNLELLRSVKHD